MSPLPNNHRVRVTYRLYLAQVHKSVLAHVYRVWWIGFHVLGLRFFPLFVYDMSNVSENVGLYIEFGSDSENDDWEREQIEKEDEEIRDFVKCHPMPSPDDDEGHKFWKKVIDRMKEAEGVKDMMIYMFVNFTIMKKMYENLTDRKVIVDCGKELNRDGEFNAMIINITLLSIAMDELNDTNKPCLTQMRVIGHWWDGIGKWKA